MERKWNNMESELLEEEKRFQEILKYSVKIDELEKRTECEKVND
jgi:hypothetical protein